MSENREIYGVGTHLPNGAIVLARGDFGRPVLALWPNHGVTGYEYVVWSHLDHNGQVGNGRYYDNLTAALDRYNEIGDKA